MDEQIARNKSMIGQIKLLLELAEIGKLSTQDSLDKIREILSEKSSS